MEIKDILLRKPNPRTLGTTVELKIGKEELRKLSVEQLKKLLPCGIKGEDYKLVREIIMEKEW